MANLNFQKSILGGRLVADPEPKQSENGASLTTFRVAVRRVSKDKTTDFFSCVAFNKNADFVVQYFRKGSTILMDGKFQNRKWTDKEGVERTQDVFVVDNVEIVDSKSESPNASQGANSGGYSSITPPSDAHFEEVSGIDELPF